MANGMLQKISDWVAALMKPEKLDDLPETRTDSARKSFLGWLLEPEDLPLEERASGGGRISAASGLFASESLPTDEPPHRKAKVPFLATLFSRESLSVDPVPERSPRVRGHRGRGE